MLPVVASPLRATWKYLENQRKRFNIGLLTVIEGLTWQELQFSFSL
jgi:hypothetical protein